MPQINRPIAEMLAAPVASFLKHHRPDLNATGAVIAAELTKAQTTIPITMQAAWKLAGQLAQRTGPHQTFKALTEIAGALQMEELFPNHQTPTTRPRPNLTHQPINTRHEPECPTHPGQRANHCSGCRADQLAGHPGTQQPLPLT